MFLQYAKCLSPFGLVKCQSDDCTGAEFDDQHSRRFSLGHALINKAQNIVEIKQTRRTTVKSLETG